MLRRHSLLWCILVTLVGCAPSAQENYDRAVKRLERAEARLDNLRPAYDAAREEAMLTVCKEISGTTPEESALDALNQLKGTGGDALAGLLGEGTVGGEGQLFTEQSAAEGAPAAEGESTAEETAVPKPLDADAAIDQLLSAHKEIQKQGAAATGKIAGAYATMAKIKAPGTPEAQRFEEVFAEMAAVKAYRRQEERVEKAQQAVDEADAALSDAGSAGQ